MGPGSGLSLGYQAHVTDTTHEDVCTRCLIRPGQLISPCRANPLLKDAAAAAREKRKKKGLLHLRAHSPHASSRGLEIALELFRLGVEFVVGTNAPWKQKQLSCVTRFALRSAETSTVISSFRFI